MAVYFRGEAPWREKYSHVFYLFSDYVSYLSIAFIKSILFFVWVLFFFVFVDWQRVGLVRYKCAIQYNILKTEAVYIEPCGRQHWYQTYRNYCNNLYHNNSHNYRNNNPNNSRNNSINNNNNNNSNDHDNYYF